MFFTRNVLSLFLYLFFLVSTVSGTGDILLNGTNIYVATGESYGLYQGYILSLKSVSSEGSVWLQLALNDKIIKSEIVSNNGYFIYNRTNKTILSVKVDKVYSGSAEQNLASLLLYQFTDPNIPAPTQTRIAPVNTQDPSNNNSSVRIHTPREPIIWTLGIGFFLILFYILRKLW